MPDTPVNNGRGSYQEVDLARRAVGSPGVPRSCDEQRRCYGRQDSWPSVRVRAGKENDIQSRRCEGGGWARHSSTLDALQRPVLAENNDPRASPKQERPNEQSERDRCLAQE